jgi:hypothetical protein
MGVKYFNVYFDESEEFGTGRSRSDELLFLPERGPVIDWVELRLDLVEGDFPDYLASDLGCRLCSDRMRGVLESTALPADSLQWLPTEVIRGVDARRYWVLHFPEPVEALGDKTLRQGDFVVKPVLSVARLKGHAVLTYPGAEGMALVVEEKVKDALERASCTGLECTAAAVEA